MKNKFSQISLIIGLLILLLTIPFGVYVASQQNRPQILKSRAGTDPNILLYLWPTNFTVSQCMDPVNANNCEKTKVEISLKNENRIRLGGGDIILKYDPRAIKIYNERVYPGAVDGNMANIYNIFDYYREGEVDKINGLIKIKARGKYEGSEGTVATFYVIGLSLGKSNIIFLENEQTQSGSKVYDQSEQNNILGGTMGMEVSVK